MKRLLDAHLLALRTYLAVVATPEHERPRGALFAATAELERADLALRERARLERAT